MTRPEPGAPATLDPTTAAMTDRNGRRGVIYTIAPSPVLKPLIWIGTDDGLIHVTMDDGKTWRNVTPPAVGSWSRVTMMEASHTDFNEAYAAVDRHQLDDFAPHIYRTRDLGKTWQEITRGLPANGYVHTIKEDPVRRGLLFAGTERAVFVSFDSGDSWQSLQLNLPSTSMRDLEVRDTDLIIATHGRGFWVLDDISVLRQLNPAMTTAAAVLFKPADAIAVVQGDDNGTPWQKDEPQAENAPVGAAIDYYVRTRERPRARRDPRRRRTRGPDGFERRSRAAAAAAAERVGPLAAEAEHPVRRGRPASLGLGPAADTGAGGWTRRRRRRPTPAADAHRHVHRETDGERPDLQPAPDREERSAHALTASPSSP